MLRRFYTSNIKTSSSVTPKEIRSGLNEQDHEIRDWNDLRHYVCYLEIYLLATIA